MGFGITGCESFEDIDPYGTAALKLPESDSTFIEEWLSTNELMAYTMQNDSSIYIRDDAVKDIQEDLEAVVKDNTWEYLDDHGNLVKRVQKPINNKEYASRTAIVEWSYARYFDCQERPKGYFLPIFDIRDSNRKVAAVYETQEKGDWCIDDRTTQCRFGWKRVTAEFIKVNSNGKMRKRRGRYLRYRNSTQTIMYCIKKKT